MRFAREMVFAAVLLTNHSLWADQYETLEALAAAKITPAQAVEIAARHGGAARLLSIELKCLHDKPIWEADFLEGEAQTRAVAIDAVTGKIGETRSRADSPAQAAKKRQTLAAAKVNLAQAAEAGLKHVKGGKVFKVKLGTESGKPAYEVMVLTEDHHFKLVELDAMTGDLIGVDDEGAALGWWDFDSLPVGRTPDGWVPKQNNPTKALAAWKVASGPNAPSPPNVLSVHTENANATFNLIVIEGTSFKDVDLHVRLRANTGEDDQGGGLIWRVKDENNYYVCRLNPLESNYRVYKVVDGKRKQLQSADVEARAGAWYALRAVMVADRIQCYVDGRKLLEVTDDTFKDGGMIGLWTKADACSSFDDLAALSADQRRVSSRPGA
ncbi:MAG: PepSY domain-containing protein [Planctomycetes bacterium]|nr:PepSY domain-containing protein [Planctomycetota bacterium]